MHEKALNKPKRLPIQLLILIVLIVITQFIRGFYATYDIAPPGAITLLSYLGIFWLVGDWFMKDSKKNNIDWAFDMGFFLYIFWPIFIPYYLFKTRGFKSALITTFSFICLYIGVFYLSYFAFYIAMP